MRRKRTFWITLLGLLALLGVLAACDGGGGGGGDGGDNSLPVATDDSYAVTVNTAMSVDTLGVLRNDTDIDGDDLDVVLSSGPSHGTLNLDAETGAFVYTPDTDFTGQDAFLYRANDGTDKSNLAIVTITVKDPPSTYSGETNQAVITCDNAQTIVKNSWEISTKQEIVEVATEISAILFASYPEVPSQIYSECGDASYANVQLQVNQVSETYATFNGQIDFVDYCVNWDETFDLNGLVTFSGSAEGTAAGDVVKMVLTFNNVQKKLTDSVMYTITEGSVAYDVTISDDLAVTESITYNHVLRDESTGRTYWFDDLVSIIFYEDENGPGTVTFSGRFYDHENGFVNIENEGSLLIPDIDVPTGVLWFFGKQSEARLTFDAGSTVLEVDEGHNGTFDCTYSDIFPDSPPP